MINQQIFFPLYSWTIKTFVTCCFLRVCVKITWEWSLKNKLILLSQICLASAQLCSDQQKRVLPNREVTECPLVDKLFNISAQNIVNYMCLLYFEFSFIGCSKCWWPIINKYIIFTDISVELCKWKVMDFNSTVSCFKTLQ